MKHTTQRPWFSYSDGSKAWVRSEKYLICTMSADVERCDKEARLIAAAPEMLEALVEIYEFPDEQRIPYEVWENVRNAIKKARGEQ